MKFAALEMGACHTSRGFSSALSVYVDNWALFSSAGDPSHSKRANTLKEWIERCGPTTHELQIGTKFNSLGWDWDTERQLLSCPDDKLNFIRNSLREFARASVLIKKMALVTAESIVGFLNWMSVAWREAKMLINPLRKAIKAAKRADRSRITLNAECAHAVQMGSSFIDNWSGQRPFFSDFSPINTWQFLIRSDGSTRFGAGAFLFPGHQGFSHKWDAQEHEKLWGFVPDDKFLEEKASAPLATVRAEEENAHLLDRESSSIGELLAALYALRSFGHQIRGRRVLLEIDNEGMYFALRSWFSEKPYLLDLLNEIFETSSFYHIILRVEFIPREFNVVADALSLGLVTQATRHYRRHVGVDLNVIQCSRGWPPNH